MVHKVACNRINKIGNVKVHINIMILDFIIAIFTYYRIFRVTTVLEKYKLYNQHNLKLVKLHYKYICIRVHSRINKMH